MDLALAVFNIGAGLGILAAGGALAYLAVQATPLIRESRALVADLRRLSRTLDAEIPSLIARAREVAASAEVLSEDAAVRLDRLGQVVSALETRLEGGDTSGRRGEDRPVESWETREERTGT